MISVCGQGTSEAAAAGRRAGRGHPAAPPHLECAVVVRRQVAQVVLRRPVPPRLLLHQRRGLEHTRRQGAAPPTRPPSLPPARPPHAPPPARPAPRSPGRSRAARPPPRRRPPAPGPPSRRAAALRLRWPRPQPSTNRRGRKAPARSLAAHWIPQQRERRSTGPAPVPLPRARRPPGPPRFQPAKAAPVLPVPRPSRPGPRGGTDTGAVRGLRRFFATGATPGPGAPRSPVAPARRGGVRLRPRRRPAAAHSHFF